MKYIGGIACIVWLTLPCVVVLGLLVVRRDALAIIQGSRQVQGQLPGFQYGLVILRGNIVCPLLGILPVCHCAQDGAGLSGGYLWQWCLHRMPCVVEARGSAREVLASGGGVAMRRYHSYVALAVVVLQVLVICLVFREAMCSHVARRFTPHQVTFWAGSGSDARESVAASSA